MQEGIHAKVRLAVARARSASEPIARAVFDTMNGMDNRYLDYLQAPQPPYRMRKPLARLAVGESMEEQLRQLAEQGSVPKPEPTPEIPPEAIVEQVVNEQASEPAPTPELPERMEPMLQEKDVEQAVKPLETPEATPSPEEARRLYEETRRAFEAAKTGNNPTETSELSRKLIAQEREAQAIGDIRERLKNLPPIYGAKKPKALRTEHPEGREEAIKRAAGRPIKDLGDQTLAGIGISPEQVHPEQTQPYTPIEVNPDETLPSSGPVQESFKQSRDEALRQVAEKEKEEKKEGMTRREALKKMVGIGENPDETMYAKPADRAQEQPKSESEPGKKQEPERPRRELWGPLKALRAGLEWVSRRTGSGAWLDTVGMRMRSYGRRQFAEVRALQQERVQNKLEHAKDKKSYWKDLEEGASWPLKSFYGNRYRAWQKYENKMTAKTSRLDGIRQRHIERHNTLQRKVFERYERELAPYRGIVRKLGVAQEQMLTSRTALEKLRDEALEKLEVVEARQSGFLDWKGRAAVSAVREKVKDIERHIAKADGKLDKVQKPLTKARAQIDRWELKQKTVKDFMEFPEMKGLKRPEHEPVKVPSRGRVSVGKVAPQEAVAERSAGEREAEVWKPETFAERWNRYDLEPMFEDPTDFANFVTNERTRTKATGDITLGELTGIAEAYLRQHSDAKAFRNFNRDKVFFMNQIEKP